MNHVLVFLLYDLAVMRVTRLINYDTIMDWAHKAVANKWGPGSWQAEFLECPWCVSIWMAFGTAWAPVLLIANDDWVWWMYVITYVIVALAASMVVGLLAFHTSEDTTLEPE
jgi:hypothetical protein